MKDGPIDLNTSCAQELGFTADRFSMGSYLWKTGNRIMISFIESKQEGKGYLRNLFETIASKGYEIAVPTPSNRMRAICLKNGFIETTEDTDMGLCEVMVKQA